MVVIITESNSVTQWLQGRRIFMQIIVERKHGGKYTTNILWENKNHLPPPLSSNYKYFYSHSHSLDKKPNV